MNVIAVITAALTATAEFFGWKREEAKGDKSRVETYQKAQQAQEAQQKKNRIERQELEKDIGSKRDHLGDDW
jgi:Flp pilus assembly protein TadB